MPVDDENVVRRGDEQRLAEQCAAGRVVQMRLDGFPGAAQFRPRLFRFPGVQTGKRGTDAFQRRVPRYGGVPRRRGLSGDGLGPQRPEPFQPKAFQVGLQRFVLRGDRAPFGVQRGEPGRIRRLYKMKRMAHIIPFQTSLRTLPAVKAVSFGYAAACAFFRVWAGVCFTTPGYARRITASFRLRSLAVRKPP